MKILIAPDKFKGSLTAVGVAENIALGIRDTIPDANIEIAAIADGGEGTASIICEAANGKWITCPAHDPIGRVIDARYGLVRAKNFAVMEMSEVAGLRLLEPGERDPLKTNTFGVGELILDAAAREIEQIIIGLGGSGTNDGGTGMARSLGFRFFASDKQLPVAPENLVELTRIEPPASLNLPKIIAAVDVRNPLLGEEGATRVFGPQKGATPEQMQVLERALAKLARVVSHDLGCDFRNQPGAGAAGGLGFGLLSFCHAELRPGFEVVSEAIDLKEKIKNADVIITGEGRLDAQTLQGKGPAGVADLARRFGKQVYAIVGEIGDDAARTCFDAVVALKSPPLSRTAAIKLTTILLRQRAAELAANFARR